MASVRLRAACALAVTALALPVAAPASAATVSDPVLDRLAGPLQLAVGSDGTVYVGEAFGGTLTAADRKGRRALVSRPGTEIAGVDAKGRGTVVYTTTGMDDEGAPTATLERVLPNGRTRVLADLAAFEVDENPDADVEYGLQGLPADCEVEPLPEQWFLAPYTGIVESHPYAVAIVPGGYVVADAAGNDLVRVGANGNVSTLAVLPPTEVEVTADVADSLVLPDCAVGATLLLESVPTDVELGPDGLLYVSSLPGGPEDGSLGALGAVYTVDPRTGETERIGTGFAAATNVAVADDGSVYVAELFGGRVSQVVDGGPQTVVELPMPAGVEWVDGELYVSYGVFGPGEVVRVTP